MSAEPTGSEWVRLSEIPSIADEAFMLALAAQQNGGAVPDDEDEDSWLPKNLSELEDAPPIEPTLGGLGLVYPGKRHVFSGPQESAKTLAAYVIGIQVVRAGARIVLIDFEMGPWDAKRRLRDLGATDEELGSILYVDPAAPATDAAIDRLVESDAALVLIDAAAGAYDLQGLDDNKRADVERFTRIYVAKFWRAGIASIVLDHVTKNAETRGNYAIGSERKVGGADVHLGFETVHPIKRGGTGLYKIINHKDRGGFLRRGKLAAFKLSSDPDSHAIHWELEEATDVDPEHPFRPSIKMEQASKWLEKQMEEKVPMSHIEQGIGGNRDAGREAIQLLVSEGYFMETAGPRNARLMTLVRPYRVEYDDLSPTSPDLSQFGGQDDLSSSPPPLQGGEVGGVAGGRGEVSSPGGDGIPF